MINAAVRIKSADAEFWTVELRHLAQSLDGAGAARNAVVERPRRSNSKKLHPTAKAS
jgi:hypothetical protein